MTHLPGRDRTRLYTIYVCGNCGSDNIVGSTPDDALCGDCGEWMNTVPLQVQATQTLPEAIDALDPAHS
jgi:hypothetical protein